MRLFVHSFIFSALLLWLMTGANSADSFAYTTNNDQQQDIALALDRLIEANDIEFETELPKLIARKEQATSFAEKARLLKQLIVNHFLILSNTEEMLAYSKELKELSVQNGDIFYESIADLYIAYAPLDDATTTQNLINEWRESHLELMQENPLMEIHYHMVFAYSRIRLQNFSYEMQYLINFLNDRYLINQYPFEKHAILNILAAHGWRTENLYRYLTEHITHAQKHGFFFNRYILMHNAIVLADWEGSNQLAKEIAVRYLALAQKSQIPLELFFSYQDIALSQTKMGQYQEAIDNLLKSLEYGQNLNDGFIANAYLPISRNYLLLGNLEEGKKYFEMAKALYNYEELDYLNVANDFIETQAYISILEGEQLSAIISLHEETNKVRQNNYREKTDIVEGVKSAMNDLIKQEAATRRQEQATRLNFQLLSIVLAIIFAYTLWGIIRQLKLSKLLKERNVQITKISRIDGLTKIYNRGYWERRFKEEFARAKRYPKHSSTLVIFDLDNFKNINDTYGHTMGDQILRDIAQLARATCRDIDITGRYGGEEFVIFLPSTTVDEAATVVERLRRRIERRVYKQNGQSLQVTASFGIAAFNPQYEDYQEWIEDADSALYKAKSSGRNQAIIHKPEAVMAV